MKGKGIRFIPWQDGRKGRASPAAAAALEREKYGRACLARVPAWVGKLAKCVLTLRLWKQEQCKPTRAWHLGELLFKCSIKQIPVLQNEWEKRRWDLVLELSTKFTAHRQSLQQITPKELVGVPYFIGKKVDMMLKVKYIVIVTSVFKSSSSCANTVYDITM